MATIMKPHTTVALILRELEVDLKRITLNDDLRQSRLQQLKILGRDPGNSPGIYCKAGIRILGECAFGPWAEEYTIEAKYEALRVIANAMLLNAAIRQVFADLQLVEPIAALYQRQDYNAEFLGARIIFLLTYGTNVNFRELMQHGGLPDSIQKQLAAHTTRRSDAAQQELASMALTETLKLLFNVINACPDMVASFDSTVPALLTLLNQVRDIVTPLDPPVGQIVNALAVVNFGKLDSFDEHHSATKNGDEVVGSLVHVLDTSLKTYKPLQLETQLIPLLTVIRKFYDAGSDHVKKALQHALLPDDSERDKPLGQSSTTASSLLRLTTSAGLTNLPEAVSSLMFEMSDRDPTIFVRNIGYGYAAGYLMAHKIPVPDNIEGRTSDNSTGAHQAPYNPVTGQRLDAEPTDDLPQMTQSEKEREAERLYVLFERLRATGVVNADNPVRKAMEEGRFEELSDSDSES